MLVEKDEKGAGRAARAGVEREISRFRRVTESHLGYQHLFAKDLNFATIFIDVLADERKYMIRKATKKQDLCCPKFKPEAYENKSFSWKDKLFVEGDVKTIMHIPINMGAVITQMSKQIDNAGAAATGDDFLMLSYEGSSWKSEQYIAVASEVPGMKNVKLSGSFMTKVFEGDYKEAKNWYRDMQNYVKSKGKEVKKMYFYYTTCPKCAKLYGKNYVVAFAQV